MARVLSGQDPYISLPPACWNLPPLVGHWFQSFFWSSRECRGGWGGEGACSSSEITHGTTLLLWHQSKDAWVWGRGGYSHRRRAVRSLLCADNTRAVFKRVSSSTHVSTHEDSACSPEDFRCRVKWGQPRDSGLLEEATEHAAPVPCPCGYSRSPMMWVQPTARQTPPPQAETFISQPPRDAFASADAHPSATSGLHFPHYCNQQNGI